MNPPKKEEIKNEHGGKQNDTTTTKSIQTPVNVIVTKQERDKPTITEWILVCTTIVLAILNYYTVRYASEQTKAAIDAVAATESSLAITKYSIALAEQSLATTKKSSEVYEALTKADLRAYVIVKDIAKIQIRTGNKMEIPVTVINVSKTPANFLVHHNHLIIGREVTSQDSTRFMQILDRNKFDGHNLGSNMQSATKPVAFNIDPPISLDDSIAIATGKAPVYLIGFISYFDWFNERHLTVYHGIYKPSGEFYTIGSRFNFAN